jgi:hypothetical protein
VAGNTLGVVTTDPRGVAWSVELRSSSRVCVDVRRGRSVAYAVVAVYMGLIGFGALVLTGLGGRLFGALLLVIAVPMLAQTIQQVLRVGRWRSPQVLVDAEGVTVRHGVIHVPWADLYGAVGYEANLNRWIALVVSPERYDAWVASRSWAVRVLGRRWRRRPYGNVLLPPNLAVDHHAFAAWLTSETQDRMLRQS